MAQAIEGQPSLEEPSLDLQAEIDKMKEEFEVEFCEPEESFESDLRQRKQKCIKNPGHTDFIPIKEFDTHHLPSQWCHPWVSQMIKGLSRSVVKLIIAYTSLGRPDGYSSDKIRGKTLSRVGSGLADIDDDHLLQKPQPCPFENCHMVSGPHLVTPFFHVTTGSHVVFDTSEAEKTEIFFFFDDIEDQSRVTKAQGVTCLGSSGIYGDKSILTCVSHDLDLFRKVKSNNEIQQDDRLILPEANQREPLLFIVSHPHGCTKHVSLGTWTGISPLDNKFLFKKLKTMNLKSCIELYKAGVPDTSFISAESAQSYLEQCLEEDPTMTLEGLCGGQILNLLQNFSGSLVDTARYPEFLSSKTKMEAVEKFIPGMHLSECLQDLQENIYPDFVLHYMTYSNPTCPGSSGASVFVLFEEDDHVEVVCMSTHLGAKNKINASGIMAIPESPSLNYFMKKLRDINKPGKALTVTKTKAIMEIPLD